MSLANHFGYAPEPDAVWTYDAHSARRQFHVSLVLVLILAAAAFASGLLVGEGSNVHQPAPAKTSVPHETHFAAVSGGVGGAARSKVTQLAPLS